MPSPTSAKWYCLAPKRKEHKAKLRQLHSKYVSVSFPRDVEKSYRFMRMKANEIPMQTKVEFLSRNSGDLMNILRATYAKSGKPVPANATKQTIVGLLKKGEFSESTVNSFFAGVVEKVVHSSAEVLVSTLEKHFTKYLKERGLPLNKKLLDMALADFIQIHSTSVLATSRVPAADFDRVYINLLKTERGVRMWQNSARNFFAELTFKGVKLTPNQKRTAKKWIERNMPKYNELVKNAVASSPTIGAREQTMIIASVMEKMKADLFFELGRSFGVIKPVRVPTSTAQPQSASAPSKALTRGERLASYEQKEKVAKEHRSKAVSNQARAARITGAKFNPVLSALVEIANENPLVSSRFRQMLDSRTLSNDSVVKLANSGSLSQRIFFTALDNGLLSKAVNATPDRLARVLSFIGPGGKKIVEVKKFCARNNSSAIYEFLEKGLLETHHGGGTKVYLARGNYLK